MLIATFAAQNRYVAFITVHERGGGALVVLALVKVERRPKEAGGCCFLMSLQPQVADAHANLLANTLLAINIRQQQH